MPLVSIIMPYYKKSKHVCQSVQSIINQDFANIEILIIDDELSKKSLMTLGNLKKKDDRIKIIRNYKNLGAGLSRNRGIKLSRGKYLAFCDCDDLWKKNKISEQISFMKKNNLSFSFTSYDIIDEENNYLGHRKVKKIILFKDLIKSCDIGLSTVILKKEILIKNKCLFPNIKTKEDFILWLKLSKKGVKMFGFKKSLTKWRKSKNSLSSSSIQKLYDGYQVYRKFLRFNIVKSIFYLIILSINFLKKSKT